MRRLIVLVVFLGMAGALQAATAPQDVPMRDAFERVMIPLAHSEDASGRFGSIWLTEVFARNDGSGFVAVEQRPGEDCILAVCPQPILEARSTAGLVLGAFPHGGAFVYVARPHNDEIHFQARVWDVSREADTWGTELPVVRESEFLDGAFPLLNIPVADRFRSTLRIYESSGVEGTLVRVRVFPLQGDTLLGQTTVALSMGEGGFMPDPFNPEFPPNPPMVQLDLLTLFPQIVAYDRIRLEIEPVTPGLRLWAFVSVTNNETQQVSLITPQ